MTSEEHEESLPDEPIDVLVDAKDSDVREETRETSRANLGVYLSEIRRIPVLSREEEHALALRVRAGDEKAKERLTESNLRLGAHRRAGGAALSEPRPAAPRSDRGG